MDGVEEAVPAGAGVEVAQGVKHAGEGSAESAVGVVGGGGADGPVDDHGAAHDGVAIDEAPVAAVEAVVAVVAEGEVVVRRDDQFGADDVVENVVGPFGADAEAEELTVGGREIVAEGIFEGGVVDDVRLVERRAVDVNALVDDADVISGKTDDALDVVLVIVEWKFEDDDVTAVDRAVGQNFSYQAPRPSKMNLFTSR